jgi:hypothetical protein
VTAGPRTFFFRTAFVLLVGSALGLCLTRPAAAADGGVDGGREEDGGGPAADALAEPPMPSEATLVLRPSPPPNLPVKGVVYARGGRDPVLGATVVIDAQAMTETDEAGRFEVQLPAGQHRVQIQAPGYGLYDQPLVVQAGLVPLSVRLDPRESGERYQTVVSAPGGDAIALGGEDMTQTAGSLGEPFRVIESLPGVSQVAWPLALYSVRGANPGNTGFLLDGVRMPALFHLGLGPAVIHPYFLERIDFYPGGYPAKYGRYVSGIVAASTATPKPDRVRGSADLRLYDVGGIVATPIDEGRGTVMVGGRYSYTGLIFSALSPEYTLSYWDYQARVDHRLGPGRLTLFAFGSHDNLGHKLYAETNVEIDFHRLDMRWQGGAGPGRVTAAVTLGVDRSRVSLDPVVKLPVRIANRSVAPRASYLILKDKVELETGVDSEILWLAPSSERDDTRNETLFKERVAAAAGAYASLTLRPSESIEVTPAMRYDVFFEGSARKAEPGPRLSARFRPTAAGPWETWVKAQLGRFSQTASLPIAVPGFESFGLAAIGTQTSKQASLGVEQALGDWLWASATGFYQRLKLTDLLSVFNYDPQDSRLLELRNGESYGLELMLRRSPAHRINGWLSYTLSKSMRLVGPSGAQAYSDWDQRHILNLVAGVRLPARFRVGGRFHVNTGRLYPIFDDDNPGPPEYKRLPTFYQADLRVDKSFVFDHFVMDVYVEAVNTTLSKQVFDVKRVLGEEDQRYYQIVLPSLGIHAEW